MKFISPNCAVVIDFAKKYNLKGSELCNHIKYYINNPKFLLEDRQAILDILITPNELNNYHFVYILKTTDKFKSLYCGYTNDIKKRIKAHSDGKGAKFTKSRLPVNLIYFEMYDTKSKALKREYEIKKLSRTQKIKLMLNPNI